MSIGIISGMGAAAGCRLYELLIKHYQRSGAILDSDFPEIFLHNISSKGMNEYGIADANRVKNELLASIDWMNQCGVDRIMIACNTVHMFHAELQQASSALILNMIEAAIDSIASCRKVGVISSRSTKELALYSNELAARGIEVIQTTTQQQDIADELIGMVISGVLDPVRLQAITKSMFDAGAEKIILGCTELPLICIPDNCIDPSQILVEKATQ